MLTLVSVNLKVLFGLVTSVMAVVEAAERFFCPLGSGSDAHSGSGPSPKLL